MIRFRFIHLFINSYHKYSMNNYFRLYLCPALQALVSEDPALDSKLTQYFLRGLCTYYSVWKALPIKCQCLIPLFILLPQMLCLQKNLYINILFLKNKVILLPCCILCFLQVLIIVIPIRKKILCR
jgi:hypothetical protein